MRLAPSSTATPRRPDTPPTNWPLEDGWQGGLDPHTVQAGLVNLGLGEVKDHL